MALDYYAYNFLDDFELRVAAANPNLYPTGRTGYEQYYTDLQGFWREIYFPHYEDLFNTQGEIKVLSGLHSTINALMKELYQGNDKANDYGIENDLTKFVNADETDRQTLMALWYDSSKWGGKYKYDFMHYDEETDTSTKITNSDEYYNMLNCHHAEKKAVLEQKRYQLEKEELKYINYN